MPPRAFFVWVVAINGMGFAAMLLDKRQAKRRQFRVSEATLLTFALAGGFVGVWLGGQLLRHKTIKPSFRVRFALAALGGAAVLGLAGWALTA